jgi:hypothetical protein
MKHSGMICGQFEMCQHTELPLKSLISALACLAHLCFLVARECAAYYTEEIEYRSVFLYCVCHFTVRFFAYYNTIQYRPDIIL